MGALQFCASPLGWLPPCNDYVITAPVASLKDHLIADFPVQIEKLLETFDWIFPLLFKSLMNLTKNKIFPLNIKCKDYSGSDECIINGNRCSKKQPFAGRG